MSPLIATVLLIAFAVALGAMIMNWSADTEAPPVPGVINQPPAENSCGKVSLQLNTAFERPLFCYADGSIRFSLLNSGSVTVDGIQIRTIDASLREVKQDIPASRIAVGESFPHEFLFDKSGKVHVELVPYVLVQNQPVYCLGQRVVQDILPDCALE
jgi:hypothetical protein